MEAIDKIPRFGSREDVATGKAQMTRGKLTKDQLVHDEKTGRYKSINMINHGKRLTEQRRAKADTPVVSVERSSVERPSVERSSVQEEVSKIEQKLAAVEFTPVASTLVAVEGATVPKHRRSKSGRGSV